MKVILLATVPGTGQKGDVKDVASGYARNFLFPKKLARIATTGAVEALAAKAQREKKKMEEELKSYQKLATKLDGVEVDLREKVNDRGGLYAAVRAENIVLALKKTCHVDLKPSQIVFDAPIKTTGAHRIRIEFGHGLEAELTVNVSEK